jgi:hypothetical protein
MKKAVRNECFMGAADSADGRHDDDVSVLVALDFVRPIFLGEAHQFVVGEGRGGSQGDGRDKAGQVEGHD